MDKHEFSVLIVDDNVFNIAILSDILKPDYNILFTRSGREAIELSKKEKPDIILLDIIMPDMDGFETLMELKELDETRHIPIIFITGLESYDEEEKGLFLGAVDYIRKPFRDNIIKARVRTHLQIVKQMRQIENRTMTDFLLDIANRRYFNKQLDIEWKVAIQKKQPISLLMIDVDHFKQYNDRYGHPQGDLMLQSIAKILTEVANRSRDVVARYGGEEMAAILPNTGIEEAMQIAENMRKTVEDNRVECNHNKEMTKSTISIGVASHYPQAGDDFTELVEQMDRALYIAKEKGRNRVIQC